jgi:hypothetical protein
VVGGLDSQLKIVPLHPHFEQEALVALFVVHFV